MNQNDALGLLRDLMKISGPALATHGVISSGDWEIYTGLALIVFPVVWSHFHRKQIEAAIVDAAATGIAAQPTLTSAIAPVTTTVPASAQPQTAPVIVVPPPSAQPAKATP